MDARTTNRTEVAVEHAAGGFGDDVQERTQLLRERECLRAFATAASCVAGFSGSAPELRTLAEIALPTLADWCIIDVVDPDGQVERSATAAADPALEPVIRELRDRFAPTPGSAHLTHEVIASGEPILLLRTSAEELQPRMVDDDHFRLVARLELRSLVSVPLEAGGRTVGAMTFGMGPSGRTFTPMDLTTVLEYAKLAAMEIRSARMRGELRGRARATSVLDRLRDGVVVLDRGHRIRTWNPAAAEMCGVPAGAATGRRIDVVIPAWTSEVSRRSMEGGAQATIPHLGEQGERWLSVSGERWEDGSVFAIRDVTAERQLEEARREMVATVSHQLRTPLASIYASAVSLTRDDIELDETTRELLLQIIVDQSEQLDQLSKDTLLAAKVAAAQPALELGGVDVGPLIEDIASALRLPVDATHRIAVDVPDEPLLAMADAHSLTQVLSNLLDNAIKYSPGGGTVTITASTTGSCVEIVVDDEGIGLDAADTEQIFERFHRADPNMLQGVGGTGLGLYVVRRLVQMMRGTVTAIPRERGARFRVQLPAAT